jgi:hypothetical protein
VAVLQAGQDLLESLASARFITWLRNGGVIGGDGESQR